jgi:hypothetical protein
VACALNAWGGTPCGDDEDPRLPGVTR